MRRFFLHTILLVFIGLVPVVAVSQFRADEFQEKPFSDNPWEETPDPYKKGGRDGEKTGPPNPPDPVPISDHLWVLLLVGAGVGYYYFKNNKGFSEIKE